MSPYYDPTPTDDHGWFLERLFNSTVLAIETGSDLPEGTNPTIVQAATLELLAGEESWANSRLEVPA